MAYDSYSDSAPPPKASADHSAPEKEDDGEEGATALLPKSVLGGKEFKPGDEVVLKIVHIYSDEVEVAYSEAAPDENAQDDINLNQEEA